MLRILGLLFSCIIISILLVYINFELGNNYLTFFITEHILVSMLTIIWFNLASITFLVSQIIIIEQTTWKDFKESKKEIFENFIWMIVIFIIELFLITSYKLPEFYIENNITIYDWWYLIFIMTVFFFFSYLLYEFIEWIIFLTKNK